jgi:pyruvate/2-oxoglutarate dehydrogenase complex dihydrolipoamide dehydrogenase (E3) component
MTDYDAIVIGAGQAGPGVALALAGDGKRTALIEMDRVGGTCLNHGCKPTKALRASAVVAHQARRAAEFGVSCGEVSVDLGVALRRVHRMIDDLRRSVRAAVDGVENLDYLEGAAQFRADPAGRRHEVTVGEQTHTAAEVYLNVGARAAVPPIEGLDTVGYLTEVELLALDRLPDHLVVVGGGYIGCEFGQMFRRFGSQVTLVAGGGVMAREDSDISELISTMLTEEGVQIRSSRSAKVAPVADGIEVTLADGSTVTGSHLLVAAGRRSNSDLLGDHGLETDDHGFFTINSRFATSAPGVWALGDVNGHGAFTHTAYQDGQILQNEQRSLDGRITAYAMFTDPPLGRVGLGLEDARSSGRRVLKAEVLMSSVSRAILESETTGLLRILVDADTEEFLGATILGFQADDLVQIISTAMQAGVRYPSVRDQLPIHPTMAEFIPFVLGSLEPLDA